MGWADSFIARLAVGEVVQFRPRGHSMTGKVDDGQLCTVAPLGDHELAVGEAIQGPRFQIGNNRGGINGWITRRQVFGRLVAVEP